jgi:hypothetical protein
LSWTPGGHNPDFPPVMKPPNSLDGTLALSLEPLYRFSHLVQRRKVFLFTLPAL